MRALGVVRDRNDNPRVDDDQLVRFWPHLSPKDQEFLRERYERLTSKE